MASFDEAITALLPVPMRNPEGPTTPPRIAVAVLPERRSTTRPMLRQDHLPTGRGLWYGQHYSPREWDACCQQAASWGMSLVHPKVADGGNLWYDDPGLTLLQQIGTHYRLQVVPYHECHGEAMGQLSQEAWICAHLGAIFGAVVARMGRAWECKDHWMQHFGELVRHTYLGPLYIATMSIIDTKSPFPLFAMNEWANGWMPQVTFSLQLASATAAVLLPHWDRLEEECVTQGRGTLVPILPILLMGSGIAPVEVVSWLRSYGGYGYCGFWSATEYTPYAPSVLSAPLPTHRGPVPQVLLPPLLLPPTVTWKSNTHAEEDGGSSALPDPEEQEMDAPTKEQVLCTFWHLVEPDLPFDLEEPFCAKWVDLILHDVPIGPPLQAPLTLQRDGLSLRTMTCESGRRLIQVGSGTPVYLF